MLNGIVQVILSTSYNINKEHHRVGATILNDIVLSTIVLVTAINVVIGVFDMRDSSEQGGDADAGLTTPRPLAAGLKALALHASGLYDLQTS